MIVNKYFDPYLVGEYGYGIVVSVIGKLGVVPPNLVSREFFFLFFFGGGGGGVAEISTKIICFQN